MPAGGPDRIVVVPACARGCVYVRWLIEHAESVALAEVLSDDGSDTA